jgi:hypothetical protein
MKNSNVILKFTVAGVCAHEVASQDDAELNRDWLEVGGII